MLSSKRQFCSFYGVKLTSNYQIVVYNLGLRKQSICIFFALTSLIFFLNKDTGLVSENHI